MTNSINCIVFICVNYHGFEETQKYILNIHSLKSELKLYVIVVDNSNTDDDYLKLNKFIRDEELNYNTKIIRSNNNGYFQGLNKGLDFIKENNYNPLYYVIGNNDITFDEDFVEILCKMQLQKNELIFAPDVITNNGSHENPHVKKRIGKIKKMTFDIYYSNYYIARFINLFYKTNNRKFKSYDPFRQEVYMAIGAIYILTQNFFIFFDRLWEKVFLYGEEAILAGQVNSVNGKIIYEPKLKCFHNESSTTSRINNKDKYKIVQNSYRIYREYL